VKDCQAEVGEEIFATLLDAGTLVAVSAEVVFRAEDHRAMVEKIRQALGEKGRMTLAEVRDLLGTSRKYVQALLEHLDASGLTVREGDFRKLKGG
jgi:selenocysteine-specific elongation factor